jgi:DNA repair ATPase RecN
VRDRALEGVTEALRRQAQRRVRNAAQPRVNTARALEAMLAPALQASGLPDPRFRIHLGNGLVVTSDTTQAPPG